MSLSPSASLPEESCSIIFNQTLYSYTPAGFHALPLRKDAEWSPLPLGVAVRGGVCVKTTPQDSQIPSAMFIVGGVANSSDYQGIQKYTFDTRQWESIALTDPVLQNRRFHGALYLNASNSILVYSGTQGDSKELSSQTFTIQASEPYQVAAYESIAPPAISPILLPWSDRQALYFGGSNSNQKLMLFDPATSWVDSNMTLANPISNLDATKAVIQPGPGSSRLIDIFDLSLSPNTVNRTLLQDPSPKTSLSAVVNAPSGSNSLTTAGPAYDNSLAPSSTRSSYALAQDSSGLVVISGGSQTNPFSLFNSRKNRWEDTAELLGTPSLQPQNLRAPETSATQVPVASASSTRPPSAAIAAMSPVNILGATLAFLLVTGLIIIAILILLRWRKGRQPGENCYNAKRASAMDDKDGMDFMDKDVPYMISAPIIPGAKQDPEVKAPKAGFFGWFGKKDGKAAEVGDPALQEYKNSISRPLPLRKATTRLRNSTFSSEEAQTIPSAEGNKAVTRRSSGWNRYWSNGSSTVLGLDGTTVHISDTRDRSLEDSDESSSYASMTHPLTLGECPDLYNVRSGSPTVAYQPQRHPMMGEISHTQGSQGSTSPYYSSPRGATENFQSMSQTSSFTDDRWAPIERSDMSPEPTYYPGTDLSRGSGSTNRSMGSSPPDRPPPPHGSQVLTSSDIAWLNIGGNDNKI
ncbi:hypothetical protein BGHDH14_bgh00689 [Blumeria hordei DH14]|uniref:Pre-mRNA splicing factor CLF1 n=1 Tax=Blumeria graminis f. sp. hordei (strain DH14) TaxID=546991 RepID=N1JG57_BLUG1|nr:hypothetical protein BGHDH14_bgh00689 [Blumeria hordei DH14]